ncbi:MAG: type II secretion system protein [Phycisphaeraceae bacterium]|nr:MAG: type II secretion system protein [Phycisphaeraceae bacterium]
MRYAATRTSYSPSSPTPARGFTLLELLIVIGILSVLIGILVPVLGGVRNAARSATSESLVREVVTASQTYMIDNRRPPGLFSQRDLGAMPNATRGFTAMENALLELSGGVVDDPAAPSPNDDNSLLRVGPFATDNQNALVDTLAIGAQDGPGYLRLGDNALYPVLGQATNIDIYNSNETEIVKGMPDIVDAFGTPLMMWVQDASSGPVNDVTDFARIVYAPASQQTSRFYYNTNIGYLASGYARDGNPGSNPSQRGLGESMGNQFGVSLLGAGRSELMRRQNMTAILGSPAFPSESDPSLPSNARGEVVVISANRNRVFFENPLSFNTTLPESIGGFPIGYGPRQNVPGTTDRASSIVSDFNDIIQSAGG